MPSFLFKNANVVLDGHAELQSSFYILVKDDRIEAVTRKPIECPDATVIDVAEKTVMPGLIDAHAHITGLSLSPKNVAYPATDLIVAACNYLRNSLGLKKRGHSKFSPTIIPFVRQEKQNVPLDFSRSSARLYTAF